MALTTIQGLAGGVTLPSGFVIKVAEWAADVDITDVETSGFTDAGNRTFEPTAVMMSGSLSGTGEYDSAGTPAVSATPFPTTNLGSAPAIASWKGSLTLTATTGCTYSGTAVFTKVSERRKFDGKLEVSYNFKYSGTITQTWASM
jgi:hypothetical protein